MLEFIICAAFIFAILIGVLTYEAPQVKQVHKVVLKQKPKHRPKPKVVEKPKVNPLFNEAKKTLMQFGYTATEAKKMLEGIKADTVELYVKKAMKKVKI